MKSYSSLSFEKSELIEKDFCSPFTFPVKVIFDEPLPEYLPKIVMADPLNKSGRSFG